MYSKEQVIEMINKVVSELDKEKVIFTAELGVSNRHVHLSQEDLEILFGKDHSLSMMKPLKQPRQFAASETVVVAGPKGAISKVRVLGPVRKTTQVELLRSDGFTIGINCPINHSGSDEPSPTVTLIGPKGSVTVNRGVMAAWRHVHLSELTAEKLGLKDGDTVSIRTTGDRAQIFDNVKIRTGYFTTEIHLDVDEANSACVKNGDVLEVGFF